MDVKLKREYIGTWIAKLELNGGSRHLWGTQGMLMRLDDRQMFNVNFDANNIHSKRKMTEMGDMSDDYQSGRLTTHRTKIDYYYEPNEAWRLRFNGVAASDNYNKDQWTNTQIYMTPSDLITNSINTSQTKTTNIDLFSAIRFRQIKKQQHELSYSFHYGYERNCINAESSAKFVDSLSAAYQLIHPQYSCYRDITHNAALNSASKAFFYDGYSDASLNKSKSIWNCSLNKYFNLKGNILALKVTVHDICNNDFYHGSDYEV